MTREQLVSDDVLAKVKSAMPSEQRAKIDEAKKRCRKGVKHTILHMKRAGACRRAVSQFLTSVLNEEFPDTAKSEVKTPKGVSPLPRPTVRQPRPPFVGEPGRPWEAHDVQGERKVFPW